MLYTAVSRTSISPVGDVGGMACHIGPAFPKLKDLLILSARLSTGVGGKGRCLKGVGETVRAGDAQKLVTGLRVPGGKKTPDVGLLSGAILGRRSINWWAA